LTANTVADRSQTVAIGCNTRKSADSVSFPGAVGRRR
jgi:hypothetical protein